MNWKKDLKIFRSVYNRNIAQFSTPSIRQPKKMQIAAHRGRSQEAEWDIPGPNRPTSTEGPVPEASLKLFPSNRKLKMNQPAHVHLTNSLKKIK